mgnify:CR=1 FL=1
MRSSLQIAIGRSIRNARLRNRWSQEAFDARCGYHRTYIGGIDRGERNMTRETFHQISNALGCTMRTFLKEAEEAL